MLLPDEAESCLAADGMSASREPQRRIIALVDPIAGGHHEQYLSLLEKAFTRLGYEVWVFQPAGALPGPNRFAMSFPTGKVSSWLGRLFPLAHWFALRSRMRSVVRQKRRHVDLVFLAWLDSYLFRFPARLVLERVFPNSWTGLYFHTPFRVRASMRGWRRIAHPLFALRARNCSAVGVLDEGIADVLSEAAFRKPVVVLPDVAGPATPDSEAALMAEQVRKRARGRSIVALLGGLARRKGTVLFAELVQAADPDQWFFVLAGRLEPQTYSRRERQYLGALLEENRENLWSYMARVPSDGAFDALVSVADILFAAYEDFGGSSNLLTKAAHFSKPVLVSDGYCMADRVRRFGLGRVLAKRTVGECLAALSSIKDASEFAQGFRLYREEHSLASLDARLRVLLEACGLQRVDDPSITLTEEDGLPTAHVPESQ